MIYTTALQTKLCLNTVDVGGLVDVMQQDDGYLALSRCVDILKKMI